MNIAHYYRWPASLSAALICMLLLISNHTASFAGGRCTGSAYCTACTNCSRCKHCSNGGSCGVCSGGTPARSTHKSHTRRSSSMSNYSNQESNYIHTSASSGISSDQSVSYPEEPQKKKKKRHKQSQAEAVGLYTPPKDKPAADTAITLPVSDAPGSNGGGGFILFVFLMNLIGIAIFIAASSKKNKKPPTQWRYR